MKALTKKNILQYLFLLLIAGVDLQAQELRGGASLTFNISSKFNTKVELESRRLNTSDPEFNRLSKVQFQYDLNKRWEFSTSYTYSSLLVHPLGFDYVKSESNEKHKFTCDMEYSAKRNDNDMKLSNRLRYQYAFTIDDDPKKYVRNKTTFDYKISKNMNPYFAFEPYFKLNTKKIRYMRFYVGNEFNIKGNDLELFYIAELGIKEKSYDTDYTLGVVYKIHYQPRN